MKGYRKILIAVNGSMDVLKEGIKLAGDEKCWVTALKVVPPYEGDLNLTGVKDISDVIGAGGLRAMSDINGAADAERALVKTRVEEGEIHERILDVASEENCDLIVMGASKQGWIKRLLGKNIVEKVAAGAPCPVLVVRS